MKANSQEEFSQLTRNFCHRDHRHLVKKFATVYAQMRAPVGTKRRCSFRLPFFVFFVILTAFLLSWLFALPSGVACSAFLSGTIFHFCQLICAPFRLLHDFYILIPSLFVQSDSSRDRHFPVTFERPIALVEQKVSDVRDLITQLRNISESQQRLLDALQQLSDDFDVLLADPQKIQGLYSEANVAAFKKAVGEFCANHSKAREIVMKETRAKAGHFSFRSEAVVQSFHVQKITFRPPTADITIRIGLRLKGNEVFTPGKHNLAVAAETEVQINPPQMFDEVVMEIVKGEKTAAIPDFKMFEPLRLIV
jgi:hypothetical protein